jgi:hypothetical protein
MTSAAGGALVTVTDALSSIMEKGFVLGRDLVGSVVPQGAGSVGAMARHRARTMLVGCCDIPPPCWMPRSLGRVTSHVCPGGVATVRLRVKNCGAASESIRVEGAGMPSGAAVTIDPGSLSLGSMEEDVVTATLTAPATAAKGDSIHGLLWVLGCSRHYVEWTVRIGFGGCDSLHEVDVADCPDFIHHWYDHFYCERPCDDRAGGSRLAHA